MCSVCGMRYCPSGCPNTSSQVIGVCAGCGEEISNYVEYRRLDDGCLLHDDDYCKERYVDRISELVDGGGLV